MMNCCGNVFFYHVMQLNITELTSFMLLRLYAIIECISECNAQPRPTPTIGETVHACMADITFTVLAIINDGAGVLTREEVTYVGFYNRPATISTAAASILDS